ncbi:MAG: signal peptidase I, partial [Tepidiformaceae bacterium]
DSSPWSWDNARAAAVPDPLPHFDTASNPWQADDEPATPDPAPTASAEFERPLTDAPDPDEQQDSMLAPEPIDDTTAPPAEDEDGWDPEAWEAQEAAASLAEVPSRVLPTAATVAPSARILAEPQPVTPDWWAEIESIERAGGSAGHLVTPPAGSVAPVAPSVPPVPAVAAKEPETAYWADLRNASLPPQAEPPASDIPAPADAPPGPWWADMEASDQAAGGNASPAPAFEIPEAAAVLDDAPGAPDAAPPQTAYWADLRDDAMEVAPVETEVLESGPALDHVSVPTHDAETDSVAQPFFTIGRATDSPLDDDPWAEVVQSEADDLHGAATELPPSAGLPAEDDDPWAAFLESREGGRPSAPNATAAWDATFATQSPPAATPDEPGRVADAALGSVAPNAPLDDHEDDPWAAFDVDGAQPDDAPNEPLGEPQEPAGDAWSGVSEFSGFAAPATSPVDGRPEEHDAALTLDLAASLESQVAEAGDDDAYDGPRHDVFARSAGWTPPGIVRRTQPPGAPQDASFEEDDAPEGDVVLQAFERHAAEPQTDEPNWDERVREPAPVAFDELLGDDSEELVAEPDPDGGAQSFARLQGWAPQRTSSRMGNPLDAPWAPEDGSLEGAVYAPGKGPGPAILDEVPPPPPPAWTTGGAGDDGDAAAFARARAKQSRSKTLVRELVETGLLAILVFLAVRASFQNFKVDGTSMYPTLDNGQFLIVNKLVYSEINTKKLSSVLPFVDAGKDGKAAVFHGPERGDIVVLVDPRQPQTDLIKRVIGLPGETLEVADGHVYINDHLLIEPYIKTPWHDNKAKITIPEGDYFVMGDNRDNSLDSRSSQVGFIPRDNIIGKAMVSYWPRSDFGLAPNGSPTLSPTVLAPKSAAEAPR